ncbi:deoxyribose-phosphate aldolase [candidate division KSB1 bacterium]|nr:deoxyribose-phosphate aldolase [candidate division KSB1 bacterium]
MPETVTLIELAKMIDHSLLHPRITDEDVIKGCELSKKYRVATACIKPYCIPLVKDLLSDSDVGICAVIAFPHGNSTISIKVREAEAAVLDGASEIDMVINIGKVISDDWKYISEEIKLVNETITMNQAILKVIFENDYLDDEHIIRLCEVCSEHKVAYVKTSTGYGFVKQSNGMYSYKGATDHHLKLMRRHCSASVKIKAAGGVRTFDDLLRVKALQVSRVGATASEAILVEARKRGIE